MQSTSLCHLLWQLSVSGITNIQVVFLYGMKMVFSYTFLGLLPDGDSPLGIVLLCR